MGYSSDWGPMFDERPRLEMGPFQTAGAEFSLSVLDRLISDGPNRVFSPLLVAESLEITRIGARRESANRLGEFLGSSIGSAGTMPSGVYRHYTSPSFQVPELVSSIDVGLVLFGAKRELSAPTGEQLPLYGELRGFLRLNEEDVRNRETALDFLGVDRQWKARNFTADTRIGSMRWSVDDSRERTLVAKIDLYGSYRWAGERYQDDTVIAMGLAPFEVAGIATMCPTICIDNSERFQAIESGGWTVLRQVLGSGNADLWFVQRIDRSAETAGKFSVEDLERWLYNPLMDWNTVGHVHFPSFAVGTTIDAARMDKVIGGNPASAFSGAAFRKIDGEQFRLGDFQVDVSIAVDENGLGASRSLLRDYPTLQCGPPDIEIDRPFRFFLMRYNVILLLGEIGEPTLSVRK